MGTTISEQAERYAEVITEQIADNFQSLADAIKECAELEVLSVKYEKISPTDSTLNDVDKLKEKIDVIKKSIGDSICDEYNTIEPLVVGLFGEWGSGKTHQLKLIKKRILEAQKELGDSGKFFPQTTIPVFFNAWRFEKEEHIIIPLFQTLLHAVENHERSFKDTIGRSLNSTVFHLKNVLTSLHHGLKVPKNIKSVVAGLLAGDMSGVSEFVDLGKANQNAKEKTNKEQVGVQTLSELIKPDELESIYLNIPQWIEKITLFEKVNFVFLIDDLDRCLPENTLKMLESIKLFLDVPSCAFVLAVDDDVVERGVLHHYRDYLRQSKKHKQHELPITGHEYLEKMIQLPLRLPVIDTGNVRKFLEECSVVWIEVVDKKYNPVITLDLDNKDPKAGKLRKQSEFLLDFFSRTIPPKPRKIKRTALLFESKLKLLNKLGLDIDLMLLAKITLLELFAPKLLRFIQNNGYSTIFNALCHFKNVSYEFDSNRALEQDLQGIPVEGIEKYQNSLIESDIIYQYIKKGVNHPDFEGYTAKEIDLYLKLMEIVKEHYNSRMAFNIDVVFGERIEPEQLTRILELRDVSDRMVIKATNIQFFNEEFYQRLFRDGDTDAWRDSLSEHNAILSVEQVKELIEKAKVEKDKTFNELPFIANPEWIGIVAKYVSEDDYITLLIASHDARFVTDEKLDFKIDRFQITFAEYDKYCELIDEDKPSDQGWGRGRRPVINVSWDDADKYIKWLKEKDIGNYRLPKKPEWELACNLEETTSWHFGDEEDELKKYTWYSDNSDGKTHKVGELKPNDLNLYDMHGNVWEWCEDWYDEDKDAKVLKGGWWGTSALNTQTSFTVRSIPHGSSNNVGFRLLRTLP